jgi:energy-coupling factor transporter ATP-binding protein EcfA2
MPPALNPFVWGRPLEDLAKVVGMDDFAGDVALTLKAQTNVAIFGPRNTGKSTFLSVLARELAVDHGPDAPPYITIRVDLKRALSIPAFVSCVDDALKEHPSQRVRTAAQRELEVLERELGFNLKVVKGAIRRGAKTPEPGEVLHAQLRSLTRLGDHVVVCFDEFQRLNRCPGDPLAIVGSALLGTGAGNTSVLFTGSIREYLEMLLNNSREPIFNQATKKRLPRISKADFREFLLFHYEASGRQISNRAVDHLLDITEAHPGRTQQFAWQTWEQHKRRPRRPLEVEDVQAAFEELMDDQQADFAVIEDALANGEEAEVTERKALYLLADNPGTGLTSAVLAERYGLGSHNAAARAMPRLGRRGLVEQERGTWRIIDPLLAEWLRRNSPFRD